MKNLSYIYQHLACNFDMKAKYSFGTLPEQFYAATLNDISKKIADGTHATPTYVDEGVPFYSVENVVANNFKNVKYISQELHETLCKRVKPQKGDILLTRIGAISKTKLIDWDVEASIYVSLCLMRLNDDVSTEYVYQYTKSDYFRQEVEKRALLHATPMKINLGEIGKIPVPLPHEKEEQERIAKVLSDADKKIELVEEKIRETQQLQKGLMQKLFTEGVGQVDKKGKWQPHTEFRSSSLCKIPKGWGIVPISELAIIEDGDRGNEYPKQQDITSNGYCLFLSAKNITKHGFSTQKNQFISKAKHNDLRKGEVLQNDIVITTRGTVGNFWLFKTIDHETIRINSGMAIIRCLDKVIPKYLYTFMHSSIFARQVSKVSFGSAQPQLTIKQINKFLVPIPSCKKESEHIAETLSTVQDKLSLLKQQKAEAQQLKKGLMQKLLNGEWRVPLDDQAA